MTQNSIHVPYEKKFDIQKNDLLRVMNGTEIITIGYIEEIEKEHKRKITVMDLRHFGQSEYRSEEVVDWIRRGYSVSVLRMMIGNWEQIT